MVFSSSVFAMITTVAVSLSLSPTPVAAAETVLQQPEAYQQRLVDWIRSGKNGYFHPSVQWKRLGETGGYAMHTTIDLPKGTKLLVVPRSHVIDSFKTYSECTTIARMLDEYEKGDESFYAPYLSYLFDDNVGGTSSGLTPSSWTYEGQHYLHFILGHFDDSGDYSSGEGLEPMVFGRESVFELCDANFRAPMPKKELEDEGLRQQAEDALVFYWSRSWQDKMIPVLDMYNHRNGASFNVASTNAHTSADITASASRDIKAGEQLQNSYNECIEYDCNYGEIKYTYTTSFIISDYGFLELYPRRFNLNSMQPGLSAEVDQDLETGEKSFQWIFQTPSETSIEWISEQLARLRKIEPKVHKIVADHKTSNIGEKHHNIQHESDSLLEIFEGYLEIMEMALEHKNDSVGVTLKQFDTELKEARKGIYPDEL